MKTCRIRLKNGPREIELEGDRLVVEELLARYAPWVQQADPQVAAHADASGDRASSLAHAPAEELPRVPTAFRVQSTLTLAAFLELKAPETPLGRLLVLAYYLEKYQGRPTYAPDELSAIWQECWPKETLDPQLWQEGLAQGFLEWETPEALTLTYRGHVHVRDGLA